MRLDSLLVVVVPFKRRCCCCCCSKKRQASERAIDRGALLLFVPKERVFIRISSSSSNGAFKKRLEAALMSCRRCCFKETLAFLWNEKQRQLLQYLGDSLFAFSVDLVLKITGRQTRHRPRSISLLCRECSVQLFCSAALVAQ